MLWALLLASVTMPALRPPPLPLLLLPLLTWLAAPAPARAWTHTTVEGTRAHLELSDSGAMRVTLMVDLRIRGGWLSRFDLEGLDPDLTLDPDKPVWLVSAEGEKYAPSAEAKNDGHVVVSFSGRKVAPWRGNYTLGLRYQTHAPLQTATPTGEDLLRVRWAMPAWPTSLQDVSIELNAPGGTEAVPDPAGAHAVSVQQLHGGRRSLLRWNRLSLPRTVAWSVAVDLPARAIGAEPEAAALPTLHSVAPQATADDLPLLLSLCLLCLSLLKWLSVSMQARAAGLRAVALVPVPGRILRGLLLLVLCAGGGIVMRGQPAVGLSMQALGVVLALHRRLRRAATLPARTRPATDHDLGRARRAPFLRHLSGHAWLDATTLLGAAALGSLWTLLLSLGPNGHTGSPALYALLLATPLWLTSTRRHAPPDADACLRLLDAARRSIAAHPDLSDVACRTTLRIDGRGRPLGAQLDITLPDAAPGLHAMQLVVAEVDWLDTTVAQPCFRVVAPDDSPAAHGAASALTARAGCTKDARGRRVWLAPSLRPADELLALRAWLGNAQATEAEAA